MKQTIRNLLFGIGAIGILLGAVLWFVGYEIAPYLFAVGTASYAVCQLTAQADNKDLHARRMLRFQRIAALLMIISSGLMFRGGNDWVVFLTIAAIFQLYAAFRS
ncbi:hypothetical protein B5F77_03865 [Parabacteroides sp. An277]|uniref:hypothetical protein n=1 Tax=Parabacteroides sp. An277 TaxID=1965619 RepID=UPI000B3860E0|nr:hypothetical protein [Parabacteroides sp. An277]OUO54331.1 hypothetical protein B5F77_03865 [Parabacteroides sp. An277]